MIEIVIRLDRTKLSAALQLNNFHANGINKIIKLYIYLCAK